MKFFHYINISANKKKNDNMPPKWQQNKIILLSDF